ncbi:MAG TPA: RidA family protein [Candidatus Limnocylindria bacterium]|nr:RidA family protein [Candidatus Limnocylindria bacterium]
MSERAVIRTDNAPAAIGPYSQAIRYGSLVYTAGQVGADPRSGELVPGGAAEQADQALRNLASVLAAAGSGLDLLLKTTIFLADINDFASVNEVYARHLREPFPARSTVSVKALPKGALVEIEAVAAAPNGEPAGEASPAAS